MTIRFVLSVTNKIRSFLISCGPVVLSTEFEDRFNVITYSKEDKLFYILKVAVVDEVEGLAYLGYENFKNVTYKKFLNMLISGLSYRKQINKYVEYFCKNSDRYTSEIQKTLIFNHDEFIKFFMEDIKKYTIQKGKP